MYLIFEDGFDDLDLGFLKDMFRLVDERLSHLIEQSKEFYDPDHYGDEIEYLGD